MITGYGHIAPSTVLGKLFTMVYTVIGIPLFMLYVASIGDILARVFKWTYSRWASATRTRVAKFIKYLNDYPTEAPPSSETTDYPCVTVTTVTVTQYGYSDTKNDWLQ